MTHLHTDPGGSAPGRRGQSLLSLLVMSDVQVLDSARTAGLSVTPAPHLARRFAGDQRVRLSGRAEDGNVRCAHERTAPGGQNGRFRRRPGIDGLLLS